MFWGCVRRHPVGAAMAKTNTGRMRPVFIPSTMWRGAQSPSVSSDALPPAAVVLTVTVFSVANRGR